MRLRASRSGLASTAATVAIADMSAPAFAAAITSVESGSLCRRGPAKVVVVGMLLVLLAGIAVLGFAQGRSETHGSLRVNDSGVDYCYRAPTPADWSEQAAYGLTFGLDYFRLSSTSTHVRVLAVELVDPSGGLAIDNTRFVPGGGIATGTSGNQPISTSNPVLAGLARTIPAELAMTPRPAHVGGPNDFYDPLDWQLAVTFRAPANAVKASMNGLRVTYRSGNMIRVLHTFVTVTIGTGICTF